MTQGLAKGAILCFRNPYFYFRHGARNSNVLYNCERIVFHIYIAYWCSELKVRIPLSLELDSKNPKVNSQMWLHISTIRLHIFVSKTLNMILFWLKLMSIDGALNIFHSIYFKFKFIYLFLAYQDKYK